MKKGLFLLLASLVALISIESNARVLMTKSFIINVHSHCEEGNVSCDKISYIGIKKSTGEDIHLSGKTLNQDCETGSCNYYGYEFVNGDYQYVIFDRNQTEFFIQKNGKELVREEGEWID